MDEKCVLSPDEEFRSLRYLIEEERQQILLLRAPGCEAEMDMRAERIRKMLNRIRALTGLEWQD